MRVLFERLLGFLRGSRAADRRIAEETEFHLSMLEEENIRRGMTPVEARLAARREFGGAAQMQEEFRDQSGLPVLSSIWKDIVFAWRAASKTPGVTLLILFTLGLGIGANTAIFSFLNELLLRPLPYPEAARLVHIGRNWDGEAGATGPRDYAMIRDKARSFEVVGTTFIKHGENIETPGRSLHVPGLQVSEGYFQALGISPMFGRTFTREEDVPNGPKTVVLSHKLWVESFGGDASVIGQAMRVGGVPHTIVGVMPPSFSVDSEVQLWLPLQLAITSNDTNYTTIARLAPGATMEQAAGEVETLLQEVDRQMLPAGVTRKGPTSIVQLLRDANVSEFRRPVLLLYAGVCVVLLTACINVANLLLSRSAARAKEVAVRASLGAGRARIIRQMLTESLLLSLAGGAVGIAIGQGFIWALRTLVPYELLRHVELDRTTLLFTIAVSVLAGILFGLAPALHSLRIDLIGTLKECGSGGKSSASRPALRGRKILVFAQVALCTVLLAGAGLLIRTILNLRAVDLGFEPANAITAPMAINKDKLKDLPSLLQYYEQAMQRVREIPGVASVAITTQLPVEGQFNLPVQLPDSTEPERSRSLQFRIQTRDTFATLGMRIVDGRDFQASDRLGSQPVAVVNESFARTYFRSNGNALGKRIQFRRLPTVFVITGIVNDVRETGLKSPAPPVAYTLYDHTPQRIVEVVHGFVPAKWVVRVQPGSGDVASRVRQAVGNLDSSQPFQEFRTMQSMVSGTIQMEEMLMILMAAFAGLTLVMVASGLYGTLAYGVAQRRQEIGIRMAMGARWHNVVGMVAGEGVAVVAWGIAAGLVASFWMSSLMRGFLFDVPALDPVSLGAAAVVLLAVSALAGAGPSLQATRTDPLRALRVD